MAIDFTSDFPLVIAGTQVLLNPSFEDWDANGKPVGWTCAAAGVYTYDAAGAYPCGSFALKATKNASNKVSQLVNLASFGLAAFPSWATSWVLALYTRGYSGGVAGAMRITYGASSYVQATIPANPSGQFVFLELSGASALTGVEIYPATTGGVAGQYQTIDSVMFGLAIDLPVPFSDWHPIPKYKAETRESPFNVCTQLLADTQDAKFTLCKFGPTLKAQILGWRRFIASGHYNAAIFDRGSSAPYPDEWMPYLVEQGQDGPKFYPGAAGTFDTSFNMRGNIP